MNVTDKIQYLTNQQIDKTKWDQCIDHAGNGLIYAYSFYLDAMAKNWDALVMNDYEAVMPLTWNKKYGIPYLYQPFLTAQLGVFGNLISAELVEAFLKTIPAKFKYLDICLNQKNACLSGRQVYALKHFDLYQRSNFVLDLNKPYEQLYNKYRENIHRNIKKSLQVGCTVKKDFDVEKVIELAVQQMQGHNKESTENIDRFRKLYQQLHAKQMATTYGMVSSQNKLLSSCIFFFSHNRAYYILVGNHPDGKTIGASHALIDAFIKEQAGKNLPTGQAGMLLDFEGSDLPSLAFFYSSFGAVEEKYAGLKLNRLPFFLRWLKK